MIGTRLRRLLAAMVLGLLVFASACDEDSTTDDDQVAGDDDDDNNDDDDDNDAEPPCDADRTPIVFVHGFLENGDAFAAQTMRFASNGYCRDRIFTMDYNTLGDYAVGVRMLAGTIDAVLDATGAAQVDLLGHSMGGAVCYDYLADAEQAAKVAHYVHVAAGSEADVPAGVPVLNLSSRSDTILGAAEIPGARNVVFDDLDHLQVVTVAESFAEMYPFFNDGEEPTAADIVPEEPILLSGRAAVLAVNTPAPNWRIAIYPVDPATGARSTAEPAAMLTTDAQGYWGEFQAEAATYYEFVCLDPDDMFPPVHYYREPFVRPDNKVYFRVFPAPDSPLGLVFRLFPFNDDIALFAWLGLNRAVVAGRDTLTIDEANLATPGLADPANTTLVIGFFDGNFNGRSDWAPLGGFFASFPFVAAFDLRVPADQDWPQTFVFNGRPMTIRNWPSRTSGVSIAHFN